VPGHSAPDFTTLPRCQVTLWAVSTGCERCQVTFVPLGRGWARCQVSLLGIVAFSGRGIQANALKSGIGGFWKVHAGVFSQTTAISVEHDRCRRV
jgi:hypothetical protein